MAAIVANVVESMFRVNPSCFLIEVPPGCDEVDVASELLTALRADPVLRPLVAEINAKGVSDDEFVEDVIRQWRANDSSTWHRWDDVVAEANSYPPALRLKSFFACRAGSTRPRILVTRRFDGMFTRLSCELLATLRELEQGQSALCAINVSTLMYHELYASRERSERGFTSDYGQSHVRHTLGPLLPSDAATAWTSVFNEAPEGLAGAFFASALAASGGVPVAFAKAMKLAGPPWHAQNLARYRTDLRAHLPETFYRLLLYDVALYGERVIESVALLHLRSAEDKDVAFLESHRWRFLFMYAEDHGYRVLCEAIGIAAVQLLRTRRPLAALLPIDLYRRSEYGACALALRAAPTVAAPAALLVAADLMCALLGDDPNNYLFDNVGDWNRIGTLASQGASVCGTPRAQVEFNNWHRIAVAYGAQPLATKDATDSYFASLRNAGPAAVDDVVLFLSIRVKAIRGIRSSLAASYVALPLIENTLRFYATLVLGLSCVGSDLHGLADNILRWRPGKDPFRMPKDDDELTHMPLAVLCAVASEARGAPLFQWPRELDAVISTGENRNMFGHYTVAAADRKHLERLLEVQERLIARLHADGGGSIAPTECVRWAAPPLAFLDE